ncbi:MAG: hypothetical protein M9899_02005 [Bdellovibrionaceae bacterium]|nr:hypothetical protein [Pseudobdellovibrionaceae bacterium]
MKKILGLRTKVWGIIGFVAFLVLMASMFYQPKGEDVSKETMDKIQENLQDQIYQIILKRSSGGATDIKFEKFWTEQISTNTVKAHFVVSYSESMAGDTSKVVREGSMILTKLDDTPEEQVWIADAVNVNGEQISFEKGLKFKAGEDDSDDDDREVGEDGLYEDSYIDGESEGDISDEDAIGLEE